MVSVLNYPVKVLPMSLHYVLPISMPYTISEALAKFGPQAIPCLIHLLGKIGNNQHRKLPSKGFFKKSYPLPRDIASRTIVKIGESALVPLEKVLAGDDRNRILEAVDAIGHISFDTGNPRSLPALFSLIDKFPQDELLRWKVVRAMQAFPSDDVTEFLVCLMREEVSPALRWEAIRSLGQQKRNITPLLKIEALADSNQEVRLMAAYYFNNQTRLE
jgi:hypothetical protein